MATATFSTSSTTTITVTYTTAQSDYYFYVTVTKIAAARSSGTWDKKYWVALDAFSTWINDNSYSFQESGPTPNLVLPKGSASASMTGTWKWTFERAKVSLSLRFEVNAYDANLDFDRYRYFSIGTISALGNVTLYYYKNDGTQTTSSQTFQRSGTSYDNQVTITLKNSNTFTRTNYVCDSIWLTSPNGSSGYSPGQGVTAAERSITGLKLYASWTQIYASPTGRITSVARCTSAGVLDDEGTCVKVTGQAQIWNTSGVNNSISSIMVKLKKGANEITVAAPTPTWNGSSGNWYTYIFSVVVVTDTNTQLSPDDVATVTVTITDTQGSPSVSNRTANYTSITTSVPAAFYTMDIRQGGHGICFGGVSKDDYFEVDMPARFVGSMFRNGVSGSPTRAGAGPSANTIITRIHDYDSVGARIGYSEIIKQTNNNIYRSFAVENQTDSGDVVTSAIYVTAGRDGTRTVSLAGGMAWPVAYGGTGITNFGAISNVNGSTVSVATSPSSYAKLASVTLQPGKWLLLVGCYAANASSGARLFTVSSASSVTSSAGRGVTIQLNSAATVCYAPIIWVYNVSSATTYSVFAWQNSGSALSMSAYITTVRIG